MAQDCHPACDAFISVHQRIQVGEADVEGFFDE